MQLPCPPGNNAPDSDMVDRRECIAAIDCCGGTVDNYLKPKMEVRVGSTAKWVLSGTMITTTIMMSACQRPVEDPRLTFLQTDTVTITANCSAVNQVDVVVNKWVLHMKKNGEVTFNTISTSGAAVELTQKTEAQWPFVEPPPFKGIGKGRTKEKSGDYRYNVRVACATGTGNDSVRVVIDPDIIVN